ncbi:MAG: hypothetical protein D6752_04285 [Candidatus Nitrosothermus koennekii]|nr:MAG: hypothetical protein D6752_04285 [Candidatus Nitrosothermus koennekii]
MKYTLIIGMLCIILSINIYSSAYGTTYTQDLIIEPETIQPNESVTITCLSEPAHPAGIAGRIEVEVIIPTGSTTFFTPTGPFSEGDADGDGINDNSLVVTYPSSSFFGTGITNIPGAKYEVFCNIWSGNTPGDDGETEPISNILEEEFFVSNFVLPESPIGIIALVTSSFIALSIFLYKRSIIRL